ncbi:MAG: DUF924 family protein [Pseudomonadota bacterium]
MQPKEVLDFWFSDDHRKLWFRATPAFDALIRERFHSAWRDARDGRFADWQEDAEGALALVILLDQFPLNMFRDQPESFATEAAARRVADEAIRHGFDQCLDDRGKAFLYLPFMHSESLDDQDRSVALFGAAGLKENLRWAEHHRDIVHRFGRFPHRNLILGRPSTPEETEWLASPEAFQG